jgi:S1-C subfamily serine protease
MWLAVRTGADSGKRVGLNGEPILIGRDDDCDLVLADAKVSRRHARIEPVGDGTARLHDLGSSNGTFVGGRRVESAVLRGDEQIQVGGTILASSLEQPSSGVGRTLFGSTLLGALRPQSQSAVYRLMLQRSVRRVTILASIAAAAAAVLGAIAVFALLRGDDELPPAVERVVRQAAPSTVFVEGLKNGARVSSGSGWVLDGKERLIVTNAHVVNGGSTFRVGTNDELHPARIVGVAPCEDLAVLAVPAAPPLEPMRLGDQSTLELGQTVVAVGFPENASDEASLTSTTGVVSVVRSAYRENALDIPRYENVIQTDAAINPGNSGGPLLDLEGRLVGVNSAGRTLAPDGRIIQGQSYAIGVDRVEQVTKVLRTGRSIGWSGLGFEYATTAELRRRRLPPGLLAGQAVPGTAAASAGLDTSGAVIVAVNGMPLSSSLASYCDAVSGLPSGARVTFSVLEPGASTPREIRIRLE